ncbi:MAG TPA: hypothetical protein VHG10_07260, partial [Glycomyces sp.]|nr:hypothetical protein [Glycomyces sp.]
MKSLLLRAPALALAYVVLAAAPAQAQTVPDGPVTIFLKEHEHLPLAVADGAAQLSADAALWEFRASEAFLTVGEYQIVHQDSGQCLTADTSGGVETAPALLADCADAIAWLVEFDTAQGHKDYRFATPDGHFLGLVEDGDAVEGAEVLAVEPDMNDSLHIQEWLYTQGAAEEPTTAAPATAP